MPIVAYMDEDVLTAARARISAVFDAFERIVVSVSGGKDSTVLRHLSIVEAQRRGRGLELFFLDQEAEYQSTNDLIADWMHDPRITPAWYQVPTIMTNATSHTDYWLQSWEPGVEWLRPKDPVAIHTLEGDYSPRFYGFFDWRERQESLRTAYLIGLRSRESFNRFRAVTKRRGFGKWAWSTATANPKVFRVYPIYDWTFGDVWKYIVDQQLPYNRHYDRMYAKYGANASKMRVSNLIHEKSFRCLADLQEFEPETYDRLISRLGGVHCAALYAQEAHVLDAKSLPDHFSTWRDYRDYLLETTPLDRIDRFRKRFAGQRADEETCRQQCKQILINDWENSVPVSHPKRDKLRELWWDRL